MRSSKPITDGLEGVWNLSLGDPQIGDNPTLNDGGDPTPFVNPLVTPRLSRLPVCGEPARDHAEAAVPRFYDSCHVYCQPSFFFLFLYIPFVFFPGVIEF